MTAARRIAAVSAVILNLAVLAAIVWIWMHWSMYVAPLSFWAKVAWAAPLGMMTTAAESLAGYAWTGEWFW